jgi:hypothetical protein
MRVLLWATVRALFEVAVGAASRPRFAARLAPNFAEQSVWNSVLDLVSDRARARAWSAGPADRVLLQASAQFLVASSPEYPRSFSSEWVTSAAWQVGSATLTLEFHSIAGVVPVALETDPPFKVSAASA